MENTIVLTMEEQKRVEVIQRVFRRELRMVEAALVLGVTERHSYRIKARIGKEGFKVASNPDTVRAPDVAFVSNARVPSPAPRGYAPLAPDLAVEVLSPDDRPGEILAKVGDWLSAGSQLVWVVDPVGRIARVFRADGTQSQLAETDALDGEDVLPGSLCRLADVL